MDKTPAYMVLESNSAQGLMAEVNRRAEDQEHAVEKFREFYPDEEIVEIECRGSAF